MCYCNLHVITFALANLNSKFKLKVFLKYFNGKSNFAIFMVYIYLIECKIKRNPYKNIL